MTECAYAWDAPRPPRKLILYTPLDILIGRHEIAHRSHVMAPWCPNMVFFRCPVMYYTHSKPKRVHQSGRAPDQPRAPRGAPFSVLGSVFLPPGWLEGCGLPCGGFTPYGGALGGLYAHVYTFCQGGLKYWALIGLGEVWHADVASCGGSFREGTIRYVQGCG